MQSILCDCAGSLRQTGQTIVRMKEAMFGLRLRERRFQECGATQPAHRLVALNVQDAQRLTQHTEATCKALGLGGEWRIAEQSQAVEPAITSSVSS